MKNLFFGVCLFVSTCLSGQITVVGGRMKEVYKQTILSPANVLADPWEITYGPDNYLWITESKGYKVYRMDPNTGVKTTVLDISQGSTFLPVADRSFNCQFNNGSGAQGGCAGLALHPLFMDAVTPKNYVYISYIYSSSSSTVFTNRVVRFTYNTGTGKLGSPVSLCDTIPGSNDHNSQRMIIVPVSGTSYLFYAAGDMGAGQFANQYRTNKAQNPASYEGKILRFNLEPDGNAGALDKWIPDNNPFNASLGAQSAVWVTGMRNNQGFAYDAAKNILYGSAHGPYSDDEINIIEEGKNYGHPLVIGYAADNNYNGSSAGAPNTTSSCPMIVSETDNADAINAIVPDSYRDPIFSGYAPSQSFVHNLWVTNPSNGGWPSEAWSGLDIYTNCYIPGWKNSLIAASLKWGRLLRLKLGTAGNSIVPTDGSDTVSYFGSTNRFRDLAFGPNGKDMYVVMDRSSTTSGPSAGNPIVPACGGCVQKYTFLGYADAAGKSSIPAAIDVTNATPNQCNTGTTVVIDNTNNNLWVPITGPDGNIMAEIFANGQNLDTVTSSFYINAGPVRSRNGIKYLDRNITITPKTQPAGPAKIRLYISKTEFEALDADPLSGINGLNDLKILKNGDPCGGSASSATQMITPAYAEAQGTNGYMLQATISAFSSFYFGATNITLPLNLLTFTGSLKNDATVLLKWKTENEVNTSAFIIERSIDGTNFNSIGSVVAGGNMNASGDYSFTDGEAANQQSLIVYYRLKITDVDGDYKFSGIIAVSLAGITGKLTVQPNPVKDETIITFAAPRDGKIIYKIIDNAGRVMLQNTLQVKKGLMNTVPLKMHGFATGLYYLKVVGAGMNNNVKLQKM